VNPDSLSTVLVHGQGVAVGIAFLAGLTFSFNPVALAVLPVSMAYVTRARATRQALEYGAMFMLGMLLTHVLLGAAAGLGGEGVATLIGRYWGLVLGPVLIALGVVWAGWIPLRLPALPLRAQRAGTLWGALALGAPFSIAVCPVCTPALVVLLGVAASTASALIGALLLLAFALGRAVPIALGTSAIGVVERFPSIARYRRWFETCAGILLIVAGVYLLNAYFFWVPALAA
jgi:cytochrome c-type biogenesis protein